VTDRETRVPVDLLQGGSTVSKGGKFSLPMPTKVSGRPLLLTLEDLVSTKLSSGRQKDLADVVELIKLNRLPRGYGVDASVRDRYLGAYRLAEKETSENP